MRILGEIKNCPYHLLLKFDRPIHSPLEFYFRATGNLVMNEVVAQ